MQSKSRDVAHEGSTMKIDYNTRFLFGGKEKKEDYWLFYWSQRSDRTRRISSVEASRYLCIGKIVASKKAVIQKKT